MSVCELCGREHDPIPLDDGDSADALAMSILQMLAKDEAGDDPDPLGKLSEMILTDRQMIVRSCRKHWKAQAGAARAVEPEVTE